MGLLLHGNVVIAPVEKAVDADHFVHRSAETMYLGEHREDTIVYKE